jgi:hypothetical protein
MNLEVLLWCTAHVMGEIPLRRTSTKTSTLWVLFLFVRRRVKCLGDILRRIRKAFEIGLTVGRIYPKGIPVV